jgi:ADP-L-glycero-D-manno-heptose 6-epimerase
MFIITGGAGFIGSALVWKLNQLGETDILVVDRMGTGAKWKNLTKRHIRTILHKDEFLPWLRAEGPRASIDAIFHLGASSSTTEMDVDYLVRNNLNYSRELWQFCAEYEIPFIYASSAATYGEGERGYVDDPSGIHQLRPLNPYGFSKQKFDAWAMDEKKSPTFWAGLKFFNVYGPQEYHKGSQASVIQQFVPQVQKTGGIKLFKSYREGIPHGEQKRDFVYVKDCVDVMWHLYDKRTTAKPGIYNVGSGKARAFSELAHAVFKSMDKVPKLDFVDMPDVLRSQYQYFTEASLDNLRRRAGYAAPMTSLEDGVSDYVRQYLLRDDPFL